MSGNENDRGYIHIQAKDVFGTKLIWKIKIILISSYFKDYYDYHNKIGDKMDQIIKWWLTLINYDDDNNRDDDDNHIYVSNGNENYKENNDYDYDNNGYQTPYVVGCQ